MNGQIAKPETGGRLPGLEVLRFVAAFCVLLLHTRAVFGGTPVFGRGYLGVDFFLMLTGFLMARVQEPRLDNGMAPFGFLWNRYKRLWPMMAAGALLGMPMQWVRSKGMADFAEVVALNLLLLPTLDQRFVFPINIPAWTIFYDLFAAICHVLGLRHLRRWWLPLAIMLLMPAEVWIALHWHGLDVGARPANFAAGAVRIIFAYMIGMALARWWHEGPVLPVLAIPAVLAMPLVLVAGWYFNLGGAWFDLGFVVLVCPLMIAGAVRLRHFGTQAGWLGQLSFPLFALQMPVLEGLHYLHVSKWVGGPTAFAVGVTGLLISNTLARRNKARAISKM